MSDSKKYYYMRLKENFFDSDEMLVLESTPDGYLYSNILLKLYLRSLKNNGFLLLNNCIPLNAQMIATITNHSVGVVEKALIIYQQLGLIDVLDNGLIYMSNIELMIGESSTEADRKRAVRKGIAQGKIPINIRNTQDGHLSDIHPPEIDIDIEKEIDIREKKPPQRFKKPTLDELQEYISEKGYRIDAEKFLDYYESNGWKVGKNPMKDWKAAVRNWNRNNTSSTIKANPNKNKFNNFQQRDDNLDALEKKLLGY